MSGPFSDFNLYADETLPPEHIKLLNGEEALVFALDLATETATEVARWPERLRPAPSDPNPGGEDG